MNKLLPIMIAIALILALAGCNHVSDTPSGDGSSSDGSSSSVSQIEYTSGTVYIGTDGNYEEFPIHSTGEMTPQSLLSSISAFTSWNLDLTDDVVLSEESITVSFADTSALVVGPPDPQVADFFVYDQTELTRMILDSVKRTLQQNFVDPELGDPESFPIYFSLNGEDITIPETDIVISSTEPYTGFPQE